MESDIINLMLAFLKDGISFSGLNCFYCFKEKNNIREYVNTKIKESPLQISSRNIIKEIIEEASTSNNNNNNAENIKCYCEMEEVNIINEMEVEEEIQKRIKLFVSNIYHAYWENKRICVALKRI
ncbi:hypothetical protein Mgra_00006389 [Meloidogyne graminicola]|uniref:Uncharacterized protein n=1 Tax=Meloidogyne graminicola TaxID=189291 RepID=A0A8S9ZLH8_9BILA|nr:hypothetical protein Mgra_00006389 [Meloidogyne graminicola]